MKSRFEEIYDLVAQIPCGKVASYGQIAGALGFPRSARVVGWAMRGCPESLPWQRVIRSDGSISDGVMQDLCRDLLEEEGVEFLPDGRVNMAQCRWDIDEALWLRQETSGEKK